MYQLQLEAGLCLYLQKDQQLLVRPPLPQLLLPCVVRAGKANNTDNTDNNAFALEGAQCTTYALVCISIAYASDQRHCFALYANHQQVSLACLGGSLHR